jgi:hypothetical protein
MVTASISPYRAPYRDGPTIDSDELIAKSVLTPLLEPSEELVWVGRPRCGVQFRLSDVIAIPFTAFWATGMMAFAFAANVAVIAAVFGSAPMGPPVAMALLAIPFTVIGHYVSWGRFIVDAQRRERTFYGLTHARAVIVVEARRDVAGLLIGLERAFALRWRRDKGVDDFVAAIWSELWDDVGGRRIEQLPLALQPEIHVADEWLGSGSIAFGRPKYPLQWSPTPIAVPSFEHIANVRAVYNQIQTLREDGARKLRASNPR